VVGVANVDFRLGDADALPVPSGTVDVVISNGVFNLCADKPKVVAEIFRVLRSGGRLQMADMLLDERVTPEEVAQKGAWSLELPALYGSGRSYRCSRTRDSRTPSSTAGRVTKRRRPQRARASRHVSRFAEGAVPAPVARSICLSGNRASKAYAL
jgi:SAM-dependent methyltransferase